VGGGEAIERWSGQAAGDEHVGHAGIIDAGAVW
jgi:hypothetical protein